MVEKLLFGSEAAWRANRMGGIGGSEIASVVGLNPYMSNVELWEIKTGRRVPEDIGDKPYVQYGHAAESHLRELFALDFPQYEVFYEPNNCFRNDVYPFAQASLDGWLRDKNGRLGILEIKTTNILQSMHREKWHDRIPDNYYCQCLYYMAVMEADFCVLKAQLKSEFDGMPYIQTKHYVLDGLDVADDMAFLMDRGAAFWRYVESDVRPPLVLPEF